MMTNIQESSKKLKAYAQEDSLKIICQFNSSLSITDGDQRASVLSTFYVVKNGLHNLLGKISATELGVLHIGLPSTIKPGHTVNQLSESETAFPSIKGVNLMIDIDKNITPKAQHVRRVPIALKGAVEDELEKLLKQDIIEKVEGASGWVSPLVVVMKDNGSIRLCVDMRVANTAIRRGFHMIPTLDDFLSKLSRAKFFTKLDVKQAFHQVMLDERCRHITTFITHIGMFRYKRLMFGMNCAPEHFQMILEQILSKCRNVLNYFDDILVWGEDEKAHDDALEDVLKVLKENDILLNAEKPEYKVSKTDFLGQELSCNGVRPTETKVKAVKQFRIPETSEELRSFLGLISYVGRFIPDLATKTYTLRQLMVTPGKFNWLQAHTDAFEMLKNYVINAPILKYFDNERQTRLVVDASPVGLGAVLLQYENGSENQPLVIAYAAKSLSETEKRYCQTEREALAIVWGVERFKYFLLGRKFELETDHRPLEAIFKVTSRPPGRIER